MAKHDASYKLLYSHSERVANLLRGFVREAWVAELDFFTLEKLNHSDKLTPVLPLALYNGKS